MRWLPQRTRAEVPVRRLPSSQTLPGCAKRIVPVDGASAASAGVVAANGALAAGEGDGAGAGAGGGAGILAVAAFDVAVEAGLEAIVTVVCAAAFAESVSDRVS